MENKQANSLSNDLAVVGAFIRYHAIYFVALFVFIVIGIFFIPNSFSQLLLLQSEVAKTEKEVSMLQREISLLNQYRPYIEDGILDDLNRAIPIKEDYFSAISAANQFANRSGVALLSHTSPFKTKTKALTKLTIILRGGFEDLPKILSQYSFKSGRLMTIDSISVKPVEQQISIDVTFHVAKPASPKAQIQGLDTKFIEKMRAELIGYSPVIVDENQDLGDYVRSQNPFGNGIIAPLLPVTTASPSASPTVATASAQ